VQSRNSLILKTSNKNPFFGGNANANPIFNVGFGLGGVGFDCDSYGLGASGLPVGVEQKNSGSFKVAGTSGANGCGKLDSVVSDCDKGEGIDMNAETLFDASGQGGGLGTFGLENIEAVNTEDSVVMLSSPENVVGTKQSPR
jgi:hypothetical protein